MTNLNIAPVILALAILAQVSLVARGMAPVDVEPTPLITILLVSAMIQRVEIKVAR